jgi:hypothetical protein
MTLTKLTIEFGIVVFVDALIVDLIGLGVIDDIPRATRGGIFYSDPAQYPDHRQPKRENKK